MKTTLDLPDDLFRQAKAKAALEGRKLKDLMADGLRQALGCPPVVPAPVLDAGAAPRRGSSRPPVKQRDRAKTPPKHSPQLENGGPARGALRRGYRLERAPVKVSAGNEIRPLTNAEIGRLFEREETSGKR